MKKAERKKLYFEIYMLYTNSDITLEDLGYKYDMSKQRVWQIIRMSKIGMSDYYKGLKVYNDINRDFRTNYSHMGKSYVNELMRAWLRENNIRLIKNGTEKFTQDYEFS